MPRPEKVQAVADISERLSTAQAVFAAEYAGLSVKEQQQLRRALRAADSEFRVYKMTLARRAASDLGWSDALDLLVGPTGLTFANGDAAAVAKVLRDFAKDHTKLVIKGALLGTEVLPPERVSELADLEPREVLLSRIAGAFKAPMASMAGLFAAMPRNLATMIQQLIDKTAPVPDSAEATAPAVAEAVIVEETPPEGAASLAGTTAEASEAKPTITESPADEAEIMETTTENTAAPAEEE
ncbi:MAG: 50S ribosomal protein L10 [Actinobacteria bacterium RBG_16_68_21]|nr:MAG: 50S ribosomal protein L10 [Actinobacteria bacterium RBG_16_68_21]